MEQVQIADHFSVSRIIQGCWRLNNWGKSPQELLKSIEQWIEMGITTFDHADIYGDYTCEALFGNALKLKPELRQKMQLITKCGIKLKSKKYPNRRIKTYDYSYDHIIKSVDQSLLNFQTDNIDLLLLHRPSPLLNPSEINSVFNQLVKFGKVRHVGVSNFTRSQFENLQSACDLPLVTNQIELSPMCLEHFESGNVDFLQSKNIRPMAWSPLGGGMLFKPESELSQRLNHAFHEMAKIKDLESFTGLALAWLLQHPSGILPILGSGNPERSKRAVDSLDLKLTNEEWFAIYYAATGSNLP
ncbi:MAG: putative oxidoreductase [Bacteroidia bacterium]|jgi:predicted oxidoreductase